jgi:hypothetical protein
MILEPSKRPFRHPLPAEVVAWFCHPRAGHVYEAPAFGRDGKLYCSNGFIAVRFFNFPASMGTGPQEMVERLQKLPGWKRPEHEDASAWRKTDDCTLDLFQEGVFPMWREFRGRMQYRVDPAVQVNLTTVVPAVSLQLISRLPRCEVFTAPDRDSPLPFRFNGGEGLVARLSPKQEDAAGPMLCRIFLRKRD